MMNAITVKAIAGTCIKTVPIGTEFKIITIISDLGYATCTGLGVSSVWEDEYELTD